MAMNGYVDGELDMMCEGLFDNIEDLLDFSTDDDEVFVESAAAAGGGNGCQQIAPPPAAAAVLHSTNGEGSRVSATSEENKICEDINICEDWITNFLDDSNFDIDFPAIPNEIIAAEAAVGGPKDGLLFQPFSPVSVLEEPNNLSNFSSSSEKGGSSSSSSSSASSSTNNETADTLSLAPVGPTRTLAPARARSKRPRRAAPAHVTAPILPPASEGPPAFPTLLPECDSFGESPCPAPPMKKKKKKTLGLGAAAGDASGDDGMRARKCQHCGIQKTPQWRAGPMGPKTLCNACGVRYKSGRLFPEYRPAASPTYVPSLHSNSHKKVVEMRIKACQQKAVDGMPSPEYPAAKNCDLLAYIRRSE